MKRTPTCVVLHIYSGTSTLEEQLCYKRLVVQGCEVQWSVADICSRVNLTPLLNEQLCCLEKPKCAATCKALCPVSVAASTDAPRSINAQAVESFPF